MGDQQRMGDQLRTGFSQTAGNPLLNPTTPYTLHPIPDRLWHVHEKCWFGCVQAVLEIPLLLELTEIPDDGGPAEDGGSAAYGLLADGG